MGILCSVFRSTVVTLTFASNAGNESWTKKPLKFTVRCDRYHHDKKKTILLTDCDVPIRKILVNVVNFISELFVVESKVSQRAFSLRCSHELNQRFQFWVPIESSTSPVARRYRRQRRVFPAGIVQPIGIVEAGERLKRLKKNDILSANSDKPMWGTLFSKVRHIASAPQVCAALPQNSSGSFSRKHLAILRDDCGQGSTILWFFMVSGPNPQFFLVILGKIQKLFKGTAWGFLLKEFSIPKILSL